MKKAYVFPGQGSQFIGMGKELYDASAIAKDMFEKANEILGFRVTDLMFAGTDEDLKKTNVTQPAIFLHSVILAKIMGEGFKPDFVAGHSLGEISALVATNVISFEDGVKLIYSRANAMQAACDAIPSGMAAILGMEDDKVVEVASTVKDVVAANFNSPGQVVISGSIEGINEACEKMKAAGAKRALPLKVNGAFHSKFMEPARFELAKTIEAMTFSTPSAPVYQNVTAKAETDPATIKKNLIEQLTAPVRWTETIRNIFADGACQFTEVGPGAILQGLIKKIEPTAEVNSASLN